MSAGLKLWSTPEKQTNFPLAVERVLAHDEKKLAYPDDLLLELRALGESSDSNEAEAQAHFLTARTLIARGELCAALSHWEKGMRLAPLDVSFQFRHRPILFGVASELDEMGRFDPKNSEFGRTYERLRGLFGELVYCSHIYAAHHYLLSGDLVKAASQARACFRVSPNFPGLRDLMRAIAQESGNAELKGLADNGDPTKFDRATAGRNLAPQEALDLLEKLGEIEHYVSESEYQTAIDKIDTVIGTKPFDESLIEFYYLKAIALDSLKRYHEAFELFWKVKEARPSNLNFARSFRVQCQRLFGQARELHDRDPLNPAMKVYYELFMEHSFPPYFMAESASLIEIAAGDRSKAKQRHRDLLALSPNDIDYLRSARKVAVALDDFDWMRELEETWVSLKAKRPFDLEFHK